MASRLPPLLDSYLGLPPESSLILLSGVLGSTTNWLVLRYLYSILTPRADFQDGPATDDTSVILVSFLRDYGFWKEGAARIGLDITSLTKRRRFAFVNGLDNLFDDSSASSVSGSGPTGTSEQVCLKIPTTHALHEQVASAAGRLQSSNPTSKTVLVLDQPDLLLAAAGDDVTAQMAQETILGLREMVHSSVVTLSADEPLVLSQGSSLEKNHASFSLSMAHEASMVISLRMLDTGTAKDISGVLRVTRGGGDAERTQTSPEERELLYLVGSDGGVKVFERGQ